MTGHTTHDGPPRADGTAAGKLIASLDNPLAFGHPLRQLRVIETHISWVILTGQYAYKIKKPVNFGFLDFSTLEKRRQYCAEELRLNRRFAPEIYLEVVEIRGDDAAPRIGGEGEVVEYAIKMLEFPQSCLLSAHAAQRDLQPKTIDDIADSLATLHTDSECAPADSDFGSPQQVEKWSEQNLVQIAGAIPPEDLPNSYFRLKRWYRENCMLLELVDERRRRGHVRDCHGDLHLGNMALIDGKTRFFDCIEFNPALRWIDTLSEVAFVAMDLHARGYAGYCWRFLNRYCAWHRTIPPPSSAAHSRPLSTISISPPAGPTATAPG
jgi:aminoglycoside phosphotransferase family enzyme